jgi:putative membrane protein
MWGPCCPWWWGPEHFFGGLWGGIIGLAFWGVVIYAVFRLVHAATGAGVGFSKKVENALQILKRRYAKGEINADEFAKMKSDVE